MLEEVLRHLNNWFKVALHEADYAIEGGSITLPFLAVGQYYRIIGSVFNDGLHKYGDTDLTDESFHGTIWVLAIPPVVVDLASEIETWQTKNKEIVESPYTSESFGGYSYTKSANENTGGALTWQGVFKSRLSVWRKL